jgi:hypothetical protein
VNERAHTTQAAWEAARETHAVSPSGQDERERTRQRTKARRVRNGKTGILPANGEQKRDLAQRRRGAEGEWKSKRVNLRAGR